MFSPPPFTILNIIMEEGLKPGSEALIFQTLGDKPGDGTQGSDGTDQAGESLGYGRHHWCIEKQNTA